MSVMYRSCNNKREDTEEGGKVSIGMRQGGGGVTSVCVCGGGGKRERGGVGGSPEWPIESSLGPSPSPWGPGPP